MICAFCGHPVSEADLVCLTVANGEMRRNGETQELYVHAACIRAAVRHEAPLHPDVVEHPIDYL